MNFELPAPNLVFDIELEDGAKIHVRRHGNSSGARILLSHGNGFAVDAYFPYWRHLLGEYDLMIFDFRNHGQNVPVDPPHHTYAQLTRDLDRVVRQIEFDVRRKDNDRRFSFDVGPHRHEARDRSPLVLGRPDPV